MQFLSYFLVSLTSYLGLFLGSFFMYLAPEEIEPGKKYFLLLEHFLLLFIVIISSLLFGNILFFSLTIAALLLYFFLKRFRLFLCYAYFSFLLYLSSFSATAFLVISVLLFAFGLTAGAYRFVRKEKVRSFVSLLSFGFFPLLAAVLKLSL